MAKKGHYLEQLVKAMTSTLNNRNDLKIRTNVRIPNSNGIKREFDVVIEDQSHRLIVFECKDYSTSKNKTRLDIKQVDALYGKCSNIPGIIRKILVSTTGFSSQTRIEASSKGIELYSIDEVPIESIANSLNTSFMHINYTIEKSVYVFTQKNNNQNYIISIDDVISVYDCNKQIDLYSILTEQCKKRENDILKAATEEFYKRPEKYGYAYAVIEIDGTFSIKLKDTLNVIDIETIGFPMTISYISENCSFIGQKYCDNTNTYFKKYTSVISDIESVIIQSDGILQPFYKDGDDLIQGEAL